MKSIISLLLIAVMLAFCSPALAATFPYRQVLSGLEGYSFHDETQHWLYYEDYFRDYKGGTMGLILEAVGEDGGSNVYSTHLYVLVADENMKSVGETRSLELRIGKDTYAYEHMYYDGFLSYVAIGDHGLALLKALADCDASDVSAKITLDNDIISFDFNSRKLTDTLKRFSRTYIRNNMNDYRSDSSLDNEMEKYYPLTINGK